MINQSTGHSFHVCKLEKEHLAFKLMQNFSNFHLQLDFILNNADKNGQYSLVTWCILLKTLISHLFVYQRTEKNPVSVRVYQELSQSDEGFVKKFISGKLIHRDQSNTNKDCE